MLGLSRPFSVLALVLALVFPLLALLLVAPSATLVLVLGNVPSLFASSLLKDNRRLRASTTGDGDLGAPELLLLAVFTLLASVPPLLVLLMDGLRPLLGVPNVMPSCPVLTTALVVLLALPAFAAALLLTLVE